MGMLLSTMPTCSTVQLPHAQAELEAEGLGMELRTHGMTGGSGGQASFRDAQVRVDGG